MNTGAVGAETERPGCRVSLRDSVASFGKTRLCANWAAEESTEAHNQCPVRTIEAPRLTRDSEFFLPRRRVPTLEGPANGPGRANWRRLSRSTREQRSIAAECRKMRRKTRSCGQGKPPVMMRPRIPESWHFRRRWLVPAGRNDWRSELGTQQRGRFGAET